MICKALFVVVYVALWAACEIPEGPPPVDTGGVDSSPPPPPPDTGPESPPPPPDADRDSPNPVGLDTLDSEPEDGGGEPPTGQFGAEHRRNQRAAPHAMGDDLMKHVGLGIFLVNMGRVHVPGHDGEQFDILCFQLAREFGRIANFDFIEGLVFDILHCMNPAYAITW